MEKLSQVLSRSTHILEERGDCLRCPLYNQKLNEYIQDLLLYFHNLALMLTLEQYPTILQSISDSPLIRSQTEPFKYLKPTSSDHEIDQQIEYVYNMILKAQLLQPEILKDTSSLSRHCPTQQATQVIVNYLDTLVNKQRPGETIIFDIDDGMSQTIGDLAALFNQTNTSGGGLVPELV